MARTEVGVLGALHEISSESDALTSRPRGMGLFVEFLLGYVCPSKLA